MKRLDHHSGFKYVNLTDGKHKTICLDITFDGYTPEEEESFKKVLQESIKSTIYEYERRHFGHE